MSTLKVWYRHRCRHYVCYIYPTTYVGQMSAIKVGQTYLIGISLQKSAFSHKKLARTEIMEKEKLRTSGLRNVKCLLSGLYSSLVNGFHLVFRPLGKRCEWCGVVGNVSSSKHGLKYDKMFFSSLYHIG